MSMQSGSAAPSEAVGYLIPEFPGQTHVWIWREMTHLRAWGVTLVPFSTRRPLPSARAQHAFADAAEAATSYLWPIGMIEILRVVAWAVVTRPLGLLRCVVLALSLPLDDRAPWRRTLPLVLPACRLARAILQDRIARLHAHSCSNSAVLCMMAKRLVGVPYSLTLNATIEIWGGAMREKFADAEFTVAIAQWLLEQMRRDFPELMPDQAILGRIGVDTRRWVPSEVSRERRAGEFRLATLGRLHQSKGHDDLLRAVAELVAAGRNVTLEVIGDGPEREALHALAREIGVDQRVLFHGSLGEDAVIERLQQADAFVLASHGEPLGVAYMEAMALEVPTIGTAAGGVGEIITHGENGLLVPPRDPSTLAAAVARLMEDRELAQQLARAGRETIVAQYDSRIGAAVLYERLFGCRPRADVVPVEFPVGAPDA